MWVWSYPHVILLVLASICMVSCQEKSSLTFVIDNTYSMYDDIAQVKENVNGITQIVFEEKASQIKNMVLVTFNDPSNVFIPAATLSPATEDRNHFKAVIDGIEVYGGDDCPEMSMTGLLLALKESLPGSFIYVFTDASAKDYYLSGEIKNMCQKKQSQIVFVLTGFCESRDEEMYQVYYDIATACSGLALNVHKYEVKEILSTIKETIKGSKAMITATKTKPNMYENVAFTLDDKIQYAIVSASGQDVSLTVSGPGATQETLLNLQNVKVIKLSDPIPGKYIATVKGSSETSVNIVGRTDFYFQHGFSKLEPKSLKDTTPQPIANTQTVLSISVTDPEHTVDIISVQILDLKDRIDKSYLLKQISNDFYTTQPFIAPTKRFKIAVLARDVRTGKYIKRIAKLSVTPQEPPRILPKAKVPEVTISEGKTIEAIYGQRLKLTCKVTAYPEPKIEWYSARSAPMKSQRSVVELPYKYISYLEMVRVVNNASYTCRSQNNKGSGSAVINVIVKEPFVVKSVIKDITKINYGTRGVLKCDITASVPMRIRWYIVPEKVGARKELVTSEKYTISDDGTTLIINKMDLDNVNTYSCEASLNENEHIRSVHRTQVEISGLSLPQVTGDDNIKAIKGSSVDIKCHVTGGAPKPTITWLFKAEGDSKFVPIHESQNVLHKSRVEESHAGTYRCIAHNALGKQDHNTTLNVLVPPKIVTSSTTVYSSVEGKDAEIRIPCAATGLPKPAITWMLHGAAITESTKYSIKDGTLIIREPKVGDTGSYTCVAQNEAAVTRASYQANIFQIPKISGDKSKTVKKGDSTTVKCDVVEGVPKPSIKWYFQAKSSRKFVPLSGRTELIIEKADKTHSGTYNCVAQNDVGSDEHLTDLTVEFVPSILSDDSKTLTGVEGDVALRIPCVTDGVPTPSITWKVNRDIIVTSAKYIVNDDALIINKPNKNDSNLYTCEAKNHLGSDSATFKVQVQFPPNIVTSSTSVYSSVEGKDAEMRIPCAATGLPKPAITWMLHGAAISESTKYSIKDGTLIIREPKVGDTGSYTCVAQNKVAVTRASYQANIFQIPEISGDESKTVKKGDSATVKCDVVKGVPKPSIKWYFQAKSSRKFVPLSGRTELIIEKADKTHSGTYKCVAQNDVGSDEHLTDLTVEFVPSILSDDSKTLTGVEGDVALRIPCVTDGVPTPSITWKVNRDIIVTSTKYIVNDDALIINKPNKNDSNSYTCEAKNHLGYDSATFKVKVQSFLDEFGPKETVNVLHGKDIKLQCGITNSSQSVTWFLQGENTGVKGIYYHLRNVGISSEGNYTCRVSDASGARTRTYEVIVGDPPVFSDYEHEPLYDWSGSENDVLACDAAAKPAPTFTWTYNGKLLKGLESSRAEVAGNWGHYTCNVSNVHGTITRSFEVISSRCLISRKPENIKTMPLILSSTSTFPVLSGTTNYIRVDPGETIQFSCPNAKNKIKNETQAICVKQDIFTVQGIPHKVSDLQCAEESDFIIKNRNIKCLSDTSELVRVGFEVHGFLETYEVCFDVFKRIPLFTRAFMSKTNVGPGTKYNWQKYPETMEGIEDKTLYTCDNSLSRDCYTKTQLVNVRDFVDGPAQRSTFIDPLNAIPCWLPSNMTQSPWDSIETQIRSRLKIFDKFIAWSGTHAVENGDVIPRYLWKVLRFAEDDSIAIVYVNGPSPSKEDILCKNICPDKQSVPWFNEINNHIYCCEVDDFLRAFNLRDTTVGESMEAALGKIESKKY